MTAPLSSVSFGKVRELIESYSKKMAILFFFISISGRASRRKAEDFLFIYYMESRSGPCDSWGVYHHSWT